MEAIFLACGAGGPQLKRNPLGSAVYGKTGGTMLWRRLTSAIATALVAAACGGNPRAPIPEIVADTEGGFRDLVFHIESRVIQSDSAQLIRVVGTFHGSPVSLDLLLGSTWKQGELIPGLVTHTGTVTFKSVGPPSDNLLRALDELYATAQHPARMRLAVPFTAISLRGDPRHLDAGLTKIKLFFESEKEDLYAELFLDIDIAATSLLLNEKDPEYRAALIRDLTNH